MTDLTLSVPDMSCGHCKAAVEGAITGLDASAHVEVDLNAKTARVATTAPQGDVLAALKEAGYDATPA